MPKREDEFWAARKEEKKRDLQLHQSQELDEDLYTEDIEEEEEGLLDVSPKAKAWFGNEYFDPRSKKWKKPGKKGSSCTGCLLKLILAVIIIAVILFVVFVVIGFPTN